MGDSAGTLAFPAFSPSFREAGGKGLLLTRKQWVSLLADSLKSRSKLGFLFLTVLIEGKLQISSI